MSNKTELEAFKVAMALTEGGGKIDYTQVNSLTGATGAYQFLPKYWDCLLYTSPSPRDGLLSRMPSSA